MDTAILPASFQSRRNEHTWFFPLPFYHSELDPGRYEVFVAVRPA